MQYVKLTTYGEELQDSMVSHLILCCDTLSAELVPFEFPSIGTKDADSAEVGPDLAIIPPGLILFTL